MARSTPATVALEKAGIAFTLHEYDYDPDAARIGMQAAEALGIPPARLLKTLMAKAGNSVVCVLVPSDKEVSLKRLAAAFLLLLGLIWRSIYRENRLTGCPVASVPWAHPTLQRFADPDIHQKGEFFNSP